MAVSTVSHPVPDLVLTDLGASSKRITPLASATIPHNSPQLEGTPLNPSQQQLALDALVPASALSTSSQPFSPISNSPQPMQPTKSSPATPTSLVKHSELTPSPRDRSAASGSASSSTPASSTTPALPPKVAPVMAGMGTLPPNVPPPSASASASTSAFSASDTLRAIPTNKNNPAFLNKLRSMVDDPNTDELIRWSPDGASFFVPNHVRFGDQVLPRFFKHNRFSSFVRQLNMYGFHKVPHLQQGALKHDSPQESELWEFSNPHFHRDHPDWLSKVQRKKGPRDDKDNHADREASATTGQELMHAGALMRTDFGMNNLGADANADGALQLASVLNAINAIKNAQTSISADLRHLQNSNQNLWQEAVESRQRAKRQQETINKILRFLAGVFGNQEDTETPVPGKKVSGKARAGKRVGVRPQQQQQQQQQHQQHQQQRSKSRLMIEDGNASSSSSHRGIQGLDLPLDQEEIEEMPYHLRFQEASNSDSPKVQSPSANLGASRFTQIGSPPSSSSAADFGRQLSEAVSTPGGSRRLSSQASNQVLNALASGEGNAWLASLFGASLANQGSKSTGPASGGGLKLDPHMVAALQQALASAGGVNSASDNTGDYFGSTTGAPADDGSSRFSAFPSSSSNASAVSSSNSAQANALGLDADALARFGASISHALVQSPARPNPNAGASNTQPTNYSVTSPSKGGSANLFDMGNDEVTSSGNNNQQLALSLSRATRDLQNTSSDVDQVQSSINSLIQGLQGIAGQAPASASDRAAVVPWQTTSGAAFDAAPATFGDASGSASVGNQFEAPSGTTPPSSTVDVGATSGTNAGMDDFDVDSFLSQFVDSSQAPGGGVTSPTPNNAYGESPSFAFSPATTAAFLHGAATSASDLPYAQQLTSKAESGTSSNSSSSRLNGKADSNAPKKRKPSTSGVELAVDVDMPDRPLKKSGRKA